MFTNTIRNQGGETAFSKELGLTSLRGSVNYIVFVDPFPMGEIKITAQAN